MYLSFLDVNAVAISPAAMNVGSGNRPTGKPATA